MVQKDDKVDDEVNDKVGGAGGIRIRMRIRREGGSTRSNTYDTGRPFLIFLPNLSTLSSFWLCVFRWID